MGIKLGWKVLIIFIISYVVFWGFFMELGLALLVPFAYFYVEKKFQKYEELNPRYR